MNDEYLWDKSGEPDPEIQRLEQILGTLRYQEKPLQLPDEILTSRKTRNWMPLLAIAATVLLAVVAATLWWRMKESQIPKDEQANVPKQVLTPESPRETIAVNPNDSNKYLQTRPERKKVQKAIQAAKSRVPARPHMSEKERQEALAAKQQLLFALRLASEKLNQVQRKTAGSGQQNQIKNQHKLG